MEDTIAAIATPPGEGGIGIIRISGPEALNIIDKIFVPRNPQAWEKKASHRLYLGYIINKADNQTIDEVLVSIMRGPKSFTREDVVEINCHGGYLPLRLTLKLVLDQGARLAEPGEFSKRAFLNGRLDLSQAEAIIDLIRAKSEKGLAVAVNQLEGKLSQRIHSQRQELLRLLAHLEASIDFPEEEIESLHHEEIAQSLKNLLLEIQTLLDGFQRGKIYREGIKTVIVGRPNVGKSSLLNALLKENRAIVTEIPGTTRDIIEETVLLGGIALKVVDTAGIRQTQDVVEKIGVEKSIALLHQADLILVVLDVTQGLTSEDEEILQMVKDSGTKFIVLLNKIDLNQEGKLDALSSLEAPVVKISAKEEMGLEQLEKEIDNLVLQGEVAAQDKGLISKFRHYEALQKAKGFLEEAMHALEMGMAADFLSIDLKSAWEALGEITGDTVGEDILDRIFADFCIGK